MLVPTNTNFNIYRTINFPVVFYVCQTWSFTVGKKHRLRVSENRALKQIFRPKRHEVMGEWRGMHKEKHYDRYSLTNIIRVIRSGRMRWTGHVARTGERRAA